jgi:glycerol-3-phosphate dehydrogenase
MTVKAKSVQVVVIGGGVTGTGILRDLAMRGVTALLVEQGGLAGGTSSRFHGLLHSGARYAVGDGEAARECQRESRILQKIAPLWVAPTGGFFLQLPGDDPGYADRWVAACREAGIAAEEIDPREPLRANPALNPRLVRAFRVPDGTVDGFQVIWGNVSSARRYGGEVLTYTRAVSVLHGNGRVRGVELAGTLTGERRFVECQFVINAAGPWAEEVAALAGLRVRVAKDKGTLLAFNHRLTRQVLNRLRPPGDGDIFVPHGTVTILGTTSAAVDRPDRTRPDYREVRELLAAGRELIPDLEKYRPIRAFAGVRPLGGPPGGSGEGVSGRSLSRHFTILDHGETDGLAGFVSVVGGKFTTFRLTAEKAADLVARKLGVGTPCRTAREPLAVPVPRRLLTRGRKIFGTPGAQKAAGRLAGEFAGVVRQGEEDPQKSLVLCECELVSRAEIERAAADGYCRTLGDVRRKTRMGMGTCQGTFCAYRALGALGGHPAFAGRSLGQLREFFQERWKGIRPVLWGEQLREAQLTLGIYCTLFCLERVK